MTKIRETSNGQTLTPHLHEQHIDCDDRIRVILLSCGWFVLVNRERRTDPDRELEEHQCHKTIVRAVVICPVPGSKSIDWKCTISLLWDYNLTYSTPHFCLFSAMTCWGLLLCHLKEYALYWWYLGKNGCGFALNIVVYIPTQSKFSLQLNQCGLKGQSCWDALSLQH